MSHLFKLVVVAVLSMGLIMPSHSQAAEKTSQGNVAHIWPTIPFFPLGDVGQYESTMTKDRDMARRMFWDHLMGSLEKMADKGVFVEFMTESIANVLMMFEQVHDVNKARDVIDIDKSLEAQFRSSFDQLFRTYDVRDGDRKAEFSSGTESDTSQEYIRAIAAQKSLGQPVSAQELNTQKVTAIYDHVDYISYGTFSSLGRGQFQVTFHLIDSKTGVYRSFIATGRLTEAVDQLALQLFDYFQKNVYPDWETPATLSWLPMPVNPNKVAGYTWDEARQYCRTRGHRLPYSRELLMAESGGAYKEGGITALKWNTPYAVADKRLENSNYALTPGNEDATGGPVQGVSYSMSKGQFWCVRGAVTAEIQIFETVWELIRKYQSNKEVSRALHTVRYELGDFGANETIYWGPSLAVLQRMGSLQDALNYLNSRGITLKIPSSLVQ